MKTIIVGAGQAGLATAYYLQKQQVPYIVLEGDKYIGSSWRRRYDSLTLFTPAQFSSLPGLEFPLPRRQLPQKDQFIRYLNQYTSKFKIPVQLNKPVQKIYRQKNNFILQTPAQEYRANQVVIATGPHRVPFRPRLPISAPDLKMLHSSEYKNPAQLPLGRVLVVGGANSAADIASELSSTHDVWLSRRSKLNFADLYIFQRNVVWWSHKLGIMYLPTDSLAGKMLKSAGEPIFRKKLKHSINAGKIKLVPEVKNIHHDRVIFKDGNNKRFSTVIWATGYTTDFSWIDIPELFDQRHQPIHKKGISKVPGLYFMGMEWQRSRSSGLIAGADRDARFITSHILR